MRTFPVRPQRVASRRAYLDGRFAEATVVISDGVIMEIRPFDPAAELVLDSAHVLLPGLVDSHVHLNDPGRSEWEGFATGTAAAAAAGITSILDMPLNSLPVTTDVDALAVKRAAAAGRLAVDVGFWGGAVPENLGSLSHLAHAGVVGFKCFLSPSGIDEFGHLDEAQLETALAEVAALDSMLIVHAEDPRHLLDDTSVGPIYGDFVKTRPPVSEHAAIRAVITAARRTGARAHIVHVSDAGSLDDVRRAKAEGVRLTVETCPHYLTLAAEEIPDGAGTFKCCPPIRDSANRELLWEAVLDGTVDAIVSDHSPATPALKEPAGGDLAVAWGGISGVQTGFAAVWTEARRRGVPLADLLPLFTSGPSRIGGLGRRGTLAVGEPAHLLVFAPDEERVVTPGTLQYRHKISPWIGRSLAGVVAATYVHGNAAYLDGVGMVSRHGRQIFPDAGARGDGSWSERAQEVGA